MRYENQNPQYLHLLEKIEELENQLRLKEDNFAFMRRVANRALNNQTESYRKIIEFNSLPWYKKAFYKFEL